MRHQMAMTVRPSLDRIDRRILARLQTDGRMTNQALAEKVAMSPSACLSRVRRLEQSGVIQGYGARLNPWALETKLILFAEVWMTGHHPLELASFEAAVSQTPEIVEASQVSGAFDYLIKVVVADMPAWNDLAEGLIARDLGIDKIITHVLMKKTKRFSGYPVAVE